MTQIKVSEQVQIQAVKVAKATQKPGQTKDQTKLISQGIEKGIAEYKKQQKKQSREGDKLKKQNLKKEQIKQKAELDYKASVKLGNAILPWSLLILSWIAFISFTVLS